MVSLENDKNQSFCSGFLVNAEEYSEGFLFKNLENDKNLNYLLTSAHCVYFENDFHDFVKRINMKLKFFRVRRFIDGKIIKII